MQFGRAALVVALSLGACSQHTNIQAHVLEGGKGAYVTSEYSLKAKMGARNVDSGGLETLVLVQDASGAWKIRHSHTSARRRAPAGGVLSRVA